MIATVREFYSGRTVREQRLLLLMLLVALPTLAWLLVVRPIAHAYENALEEQLEAVDRHGRVLALAEGAKSRPEAGQGVARDVDLQLLITQSAGQSGIALQAADPVDPDTIDIVIEGARAPAIGEWLQQLEAGGLRVRELRMEPQGTGLASANARLARGA